MSYTSPRPLYTLHRTHSGSCFVCYKQTEFILRTDSDWFYTCTTHIRDPSFCKVQKKEVDVIDIKQAELDSELEKELEQEVKQASQQENNGEKSDDKDRKSDQDDKHVTPPDTNKDDNNKSRLAKLFSFTPVDQKTVVEARSPKSNAEKLPPKKQTIIEGYILDSKIIYLRYELFRCLMSRMAPATISNHYQWYGNKSGLGLARDHCSMFLGLITPALYDLGLAKRC